jgi:uncharacterized iron-regulated protein
MSVLKIAKILFLVFYCNLVFGQITEKNYKIYSVKLNKEVSVEDIVADMKYADVLFYGEEHNDAVTHFLENKLLEGLHAAFSNSITLSMEMFERDVQPIMNEYLTTDIRENTFKKDARAWGNYKDYRPMVEFCKANNLDVVCANSAARYTNLAGRKGQSELLKLPLESKQFFAPLPYDTASGNYYQKLIHLFDDGTPKRKKDTTPKKESFNLAMAQSLWDATMAYSISNYLEKHPTKKIFQINGRFHSDEGFGSVTQLKNYSPNTKVLVISSGKDKSFPNINWETYKHLGDYIIITDPKIPTTYKD